MFLRRFRDKYACHCFFPDSYLGYRVIDKSSGGWERNFTHAYIGKIKQKTDEKIKVFCLKCLGIVRDDK